MFFKGDITQKREKVPSLVRKKHLDPHSAGGKLAEKSLNKFKDAVMKK